jgi:hypothetical protein
MTDEVIDAEFVEDDAPAAPRQCIAPPVEGPTLADVVARSSPRFARLVGLGRVILGSLARHSGEEHRPFLPRK